MTQDRTPGNGKLDSVVARARQSRAQREAGYREQSLKLYPWVCGRCSREFTRANLHELTVHHRDHNHDNNPSDGSNWELLCLYCHDNEHARYLEQLDPTAGGAGNDGLQASHKGLAGLADLLKKKDG
ncbi:MAG TPA: YajD family HNH nuclease [Gammaproteobacteria bacterium]|nr:YajD family HNH nuclease [Gammaproteobacteria bacterium]